MQELSNNFKKLLAHLELSSEHSEQFQAALYQPTTQPSALLWLSEQIKVSPLATPKWFPEFATLVPADSKPGKDDLHQLGHYYCLDSSSIFSMCPLSILERSLQLVIDLCSAPGGKAICAWRALRPQSLICNEVISKRIGALISNLKRCQITPCTVYCADTRIIADHFYATAQLIIVDAPCSGQSLLAKGLESPGCFHPAVINTNANRQRRILANAAQCLETGGHLLYSTCTYSIKENEDTVRWFLKKFPAFEAVAVPAIADHQSAYSESACYRLWPWQGGAGAFTCLLRCNSSQAKDNSKSKDKVFEPRPRWQG